jgi:AraC-like DNA-binding protein
MIEVLSIKNMVCDRCIRVVKEELEKLHYTVKKVKLGQATIESTTAVNIQTIKSALEASGFELLEDRKVQLVEQVKTLLIELIHHTDEGLKTTYSEYLSSVLGKDYSYLSSLFSSVENITIEKYIILQKIEKVKELLVYDELTLSEISYRLGYSSVAHLSSQFKQTTGFTPTAFKQQKSKPRKTLDHITR